MFGAEERWALAWWGQSSEPEQKAAVKAAAHANTPTTTYLDVLGRNFFTVRENLAKETQSLRTLHDIEGRLLEVEDAAGRVVATRNYDMLDNPIFNASMDHGSRWHLFGLFRESLLQWDTLGNRFRSEYDPVRRPSAFYCQNPQNNIAEYMISKTVYGESQPNPETLSLRGQIYQVCDQAGVLTNGEWDFKGNLKMSLRQLAQEYKLAIDWSQKIALDPNIYASLKLYDALDRVVSTTMPDNTVIQNTFDKSSFLKSFRCNFQGERGASGEPVWTGMLLNREYNAWGKPSVSEIGNGTRMTSSYDPLTMRLSQHTVDRKGTKILDFAYTYDPVGNITCILNNAAQTTFFRSGPVKPHSASTYDALYRLIEGRGREHLGQTSGAPMGPEDQQSLSMEAPGDGTAMARYIELYVYDNCNNLTSLQHQPVDTRFTAWTRNFSYNEPSALGSQVKGNRLSLTTVGSKTESYTYGQHGNMTSMPHLSQVQWNCFDMIRCLSQQKRNTGTPETTWYVYDLEGHRVRKVTEREQPPGAPPGRKLSERITIGDYDVYQEYSGSEDVTKRCESLHLRDDDVHLALVEHWSGPLNKSPSRLLRFQLQGRVESINVELDDAGNLVSYEEFTPYGNTSYRSLVGDAPKRYRFAEKERDKESSLYYCGQRYYIPWLGRWMSADPLDISPGPNVLEYSNSNPIIFTDGEGLQPTTTKRPRTRSTSSTSSDSTTGTDSTTSLSTAPTTAAASVNSTSPVASLDAGGSSSLTAAQLAFYQGLIGSDYDTAEQHIANTDRLVESLRGRKALDQAHLMYDSLLRMLFQKVNIEVDHYTIVVEKASHKYMTNPPARGLSSSSSSSGSGSLSSSSSGLASGGRKTPQELVTGTDNLWLNWYHDRANRDDIMLLKRASPRAGGGSDLPTSEIDRLRTKIFVQLDVNLMILGLPRLAELKSAAVTNKVHLHTWTGANQREWEDQELTLEHLEMFNAARKEYLRMRRGSTTSSGAGAVPAWLAGLQVPAATAAAATAATASTSAVPAQRRRSTRGTK